MEKYIRKPVEVEAEQYFDGKEMPEIYINYPLIFTMTDVTDFENPKKYFYVSNCGAKNWLSIEVGEDGKRYSESFERWYDSTGSYQYNDHTDAKSFEIDDPLVQIYLEEFDLDWPLPHAYLKGLSELVKNSDWIVKKDGVVKIYSDKDFKNKFQRPDSHLEFYDQMYKCLSEDREAFSAEFRKDNL